MKLEKQSIKILEKALARLDGGFTDLPDDGIEYDYSKIENVILAAAEKMQDSYPFFHPLYAGQMLKPPHPVARIAYMLSMWINPNNHALDGGPASSHLEREAVAEIAGMFGWTEFLGHLTGGGTMANLEALWVSGREKPGRKIVASSQSHYTHQRISDVLGLQFEAVPCDDRGRMDTAALKKILEGGDVGTVIATIGTTGTGAIDPLGEILELRPAYDLRVHVDSAYGGYYILADNLSSETRAVYDRLGEADSIVIDPHKHGLQPYGCGCILYKDPGVGRHYKHDSPYTYFTSAELHLGEISLECSRPGASATALWATQQLLPLVPGGEFAGGLSNCRQSALALHDKIIGDENYRPLFPPELDIVVWAPRGESATQISSRSEAIFEAVARENLHIAKFKYPSESLKATWTDVNFDQPQVICLRSCLMKPEHLDWINRIWTILQQAATRA
jgi:tyrosine decarboxylase/aspartate 1-decarboxylase